MSLIDKLISNIAPHDCLGCGYEGKLICVQCVNNFEKIPERCYRCRKLSPQFRTCLSCSRMSGLNQVYVPTVYDKLAKDLMWQLKFYGVQAAAMTMSKYMLPLLPSDAQACLVPVPTATKRARGRGYDQAKLLAHELSRRSHLPYVDCLRRSGQTHQVGASRKERLQQLEAAFHVKRNLVRDQNIILIDDVITTGATLEAAAATLKEAGVRHISALVFAQPRRNLGIEA